MSTADVRWVQLAESKFRLKPHRQRAPRPHRMPILVRSGDCLRVSIASMVPQSVKAAIYRMAGSPSPVSR